MSPANGGEDPDNTEIPPGGRVAKSLAEEGGVHVVGLLWKQGSRARAFFFFSFFLLMLHSEFGSTDLAWRQP